jgi:hypothetical protein
MAQHFSETVAQSIEVPHPVNDWNRLKLNQEVNIAASRVKVRTDCRPKYRQAANLVLTAQTDDFVEIALYWAFHVASGIRIAPHRHEVWDNES